MERETDEIRRDVRSVRALILAAWVSTLALIGGVGILCLETAHLRGEVRALHARVDSLGEAVAYYRARYEEHKGKWTAAEYELTLVKARLIALEGERHAKRPPASADPR